ncbi:MAG: four helix bundle protein [Mucilaginibacter sp.]|uniref:four helix bundle protein n=1 Tax=Mucilaginibacter sp. TaxID=1882438 RepID=UPI0032671D8D
MATSIGANYEEAQGASSKKDFNHRITIAYREARESVYWLRILRELYEDELKRVFASIKLSSQNK